MGLPDQTTERPRRHLTPDELVRLIDAAAASPRTVRHLPGPARAVLYLVAAATGLRAAELAGLTPGHFDLAADVPVVRLIPAETKNGKAAVQPLPPVAAERLREFLAGRPATCPMWPGLWWHKAATMIRADMAAAVIPALAGGEGVVFHSLRHSYTTLLARVAPVKVTQELARHSTPVLTIGTHSHRGMAEKAEAVGRMQLPGANPAGELSRSDLAGMVLVLAAVFDAVVAPVAPVPRSPGDGSGRMGTDGRVETSAGGNEETPGFPGVYVGSGLTRTE